MFLILTCMLKSKLFALGCSLLLATSLSAQTNEVDRTEQKRIIMHIKRLGGQGDIDEERLSKPIVAVNLAHTKATNADLLYLKNLKTLRKLKLGSSITNAGLVHVTQLNRLEHLGLSSIKITDRGLIHLKRLSNLEHLDLQGSGVTGPGLTSLQRLPHLQSLFWSGGKITNQSLAHLKVLPNLQELTLAYTKVSDDGLAQLKSLKKLRYLHIRSGYITDRGLQHIRALAGLELLQIPSTPHITDAGITDLQKARPNLTIQTFRESHSQQPTTQR